MAIKFNLEKVYERLNWDFIQDTPEEKRLPRSLIEVIMSCVTSCSIQILWNGELTEQFFPSWGIRQGETLSPHLFVAFMERLSQLIDDLFRTKQQKHNSYLLGWARDFKYTFYEGHHIICRGY